jgi:hypothetical protein
LIFDVHFYFVLAFGLFVLDLKIVSHDVAAKSTFISSFFIITKPLILLTQTGLPNKSSQPMPGGALSRVRASLARHGWKQRLIVN